MYEFITEGMSCENCVKHVTEAVNAVDTNAKVRIDLTLQKITVKSTQTPQILIEAIEDAGYPILKSERK